MRILTVIIFITITFFNFGQIKPELLKVSLTECEENCQKDTGLIKCILTKDTLEIEAGIIFNCCGNFIANFDFWNADTLNLILFSKPNEDGAISMCVCNCYYILKYKFKNVNCIPSLILINGETFEKNNNQTHF